MAVICRKTITERFTDPPAASLTRLTGSTARGSVPGGTFGDTAAETFFVTTLTPTTPFSDGVADAAGVLMHGLCGPFSDDINEHQHTA